MTEQEAIKGSIAHWERMVKWADEQPPLDLVSWDNMEFAIKELPNAEGCYLCRVYNMGFEGCPACPLAIEYGWCTNSTNAFYDADSARHWHGFVKHGKRLIEQLKSLVKS